MNFYDQLELIESNNPSILAITLKDDFNENHCRSFVRVFKKNSHLKSISLKSTGYLENKRGYELLAESLRNNQNLESISLYGFNSFYSRHVIDALGTLKNLKNLVLNYYIHSVDLLTVAKVVKKLKNLELLNIARPKSFGMYHEDVLENYNEFLFDVLKNKKLKKLVVAAVDFFELCSDKNIEKFKTLLKANPELSIEIVGDLDVTTAIKALKNQIPLTNLVLKRPKFLSEEDSVEFSDLLKVNTSLSSLKLANILFSQEALSNLSAAFATNKTLTEITLKNIYPVDDHLNLVPLIDALKQNKGLKKLTINIGHKSELESIKELIKLNPNLKLSLDYSFNDIEEIKSLPIEQLVLTHRNTKETVQNLISVLQQDSKLSSTLHTLIFNSGLEIETQSELIAYLTTNSVITNIFYVPYIKNDEIEALLERNRRIGFLSNLIFDYISYCENNCLPENFNWIEASLKNIHLSIEKIKTLCQTALQLKLIINRLFDFYAKHLSYKTTLDYFSNLSLEEQNYISNDKIINFMAEVVANGEMLDAEEWEHSAQILCSPRFKEDKDVDLFLFFSLNNYLLPKSKQITAPTSLKFTSLLEKLQQDNRLLAKESLPTFEKDQILENESKAKIFLIDYFKQRKTPAGKLTYLIDNYFKQREAQVDSDNQVMEYYYGSFFSYFQKSFTEKSAAVWALKKALDNEPVPDLLNHLSTLRNGDLGKAIRAFVKAGNADEIVNGRPRTVSDFISALNQKINNKSMDTPSH